MPDLNMVYGGNRMKLRPLADNILLKATEAEETTSSGIILATTNKEHSGIFEVVAAGPGTEEKPVVVSVGDKVVVGKYTGSEFKLDGEDYKFVKQEEILAIVTE
jgi:chaperonin GroES